MRFLWMLLIAGCLFGDSGYSFCIDGGGSKTLLQVINQEGQIVPLKQEGRLGDRIVAAGSNINLVGLEGVREVINTLFANSFLIEEGREWELSSLISEGHVIAALAGASHAQNKQSIQSLFQERGARAENILVMSDAEMTLQLIQDEGIILIAGTGSICLGKRKEARFRVGGLGRILGDEGSGYQIGLQALKAALAEEYGWGICTSLTPALKELFEVSELRSLISPITRGEIPPSKIAASAPLVFEHGWEKGDEVAKDILNGTAKELAALLIHMGRLSSLSECEVHLWGGLFKNRRAEELIQKIRERLPASYSGFHLINRSQENPTVLYVQGVLKNQLMNQRP